MIMVRQIEMVAQLRECSLVDIPLEIDDFRDRMPVINPRPGIKFRFT